jgi:hypothetical protein
MQNSVVAPGLSDPIYPVGEYEDLAAAMNAVLTDMKSELDYGTTMYLPNDGPYEVTSGKVTIPMFGVEDMGWDGGPTIVGGGEMASSIHVESSFPDDVFLDTPLEQDGTARTNHGLLLRNFRLMNKGGCETLVRLRNWALATLSNVNFISNDGVGLALTQPDSGCPCFVNGYDLEFRVKGGTGVKGEVSNMLWMTGCRVSGVGGVGFDIAAGAVVLHADVAGVDTGTIVRNPGTMQGDGTTAGVPETPLTSDEMMYGGNVIYQRTERPGQFLPEEPHLGVQTPIDIRGAQGTTIFPIGTTGGTIRHSRDGGVDTEWMTGSWVRNPRVDIGGGGGRSLPDRFRVTGEASPAAGRDRLVAPARERARIDTYNPVAGGETALNKTSPAFRTEFRVPMQDGNARGETRVGLVQSPGDTPWSDWAGVTLDGTASEPSFHLVVVREGDAILDFDTGIPPLPPKAIVRISLGPRPFERVDDVPTGWESGNATPLEGEVTVSMTQVSGGPGNHAAAWETARVPKQFDTIRPVYSLDNDTGRKIELDVIDGSLWRTRDSHGL